LEEFFQRETTSKK